MPSSRSRSHTRSLSLSVAMLVTALAAHAAGTVQVSFVAPADYTDAGNDRASAETNRAELAAYLQRLGDHVLASDQVLKIDVLDIDLAGTVRPTRHGAGQLVRIARGGADFPRIRLRYWLEGNGWALQSGEETVTDLDYARHAIQRRPEVPLAYEKRMLADWFNARFVEHKSAVR